jgi:hypothetical protein
MNTRPPQEGTTVKSTGRHANTASTPKAHIVASLRSLLPSGLIAVGCASSIAATLAVLSLGAGSAFAAVEHAQIGQFDGAGNFEVAGTPKTGPATPAGSLGGVNGIAVDAATGDVYTADPTHNVIDKFDANGKYICQITGSTVPSATECNGLEGSATPAGTLRLPQPESEVGLAVDNSGESPAEDPSVGDLYVTDTVENPETAAIENVVEKFSASGKYEGEITTGAEGGPLLAVYGVAVDTHGVVWVMENGAPGRIDNYSDAAANQFISSRPSGAGGFSRPGLAADGSGDLYSVHRLSEQVAKLTDTGEVIEEAVGNLEGAVGVASDQSNNTVYLDTGTNIAEFDSGLNSLSEFGSGQLGAGGEGAIAVDPATGTIYVANAADEKVFVYAATPGPRVKLAPTTAITANAATLNATVNPDGADTTYQFEYGTDTSYGSTSPLTPADAGSGSTPVPVTTDLSQLEGGTEYHYRIVATSGGVTEASADGIFTTSPVPVIEGTSTSNLVSSSADLNATINPRGVDTTYRLQYGLSTAYGSTAPVAGEPDIGSGLAGVAVTQHVPIEANKTYHWRVVATSANGTTTGVDHTFIYETTGEGLPDGRAYEMVSPPHKNDAFVGDAFAMGPFISPDGSHLLAGNIQCFGDTSQSCTADRESVGTPYLFSRTSAGWAAASLGPPASELPDGTSWKYTAATGTVLWSFPTAPFGEDDWYARESNGTFHDIGPASPPELGAQGTQLLGPHILVTADLSHIVWNGTFGDAWPFDESSGHVLYEYVGTGNTAPTMVGVTGGRGSHELISQCTTFGGAKENASQFGGISADGSRVFFTAKGKSGGCPAARAPEVSELYVRANESETIPISQPSPSECGSGALPDEESCRAAPQAAAEFQGASTDGSKAFFTSTQQLVDQASEDSSDTVENTYECQQTTSAGGCNLYEYDFNAPAGHNVVDVSAGDSTDSGPSEQSVIAISPDGSHVYFIAKGVLDRTANEAGDTARSGAKNLYVFERDAAHPAGTVRFIATLSPSDSSFDNSEVGTANVTSDGRFLAFESHGNLTGENVNPLGTQIYRYDAQTADLVRISIGEHGFNDNGADSTLNARIVPGHFGVFQGAPARLDPSMSDDGEYVFFESQVGLTRHALNEVVIGRNPSGGPAYANNIYEYHDGQVSLITDGRDTTELDGKSTVELFGTDASGADVFFRTADQLVPQDTDTQLDFYDARIGGGFPAESSPPQCGEGTCQPANPAAAAKEAPGSATATGAGNLHPPVSAPVRPKPLTRAQKLTRALKACKHRPRHARKACEAQARRQFGPPARKAASAKSTRRSR